MVTTSGPCCAAGLWVMGQLSFVDCLALTACIYLGALLGSLGVYIYHLPHFKTLPEPAPVNSEDALLRSRDAVSRNALKCAAPLLPPFYSLKRFNKGFAACASLLYISLLFSMPFDSSLLYTGLHGLRPSQRQSCAGLRNLLEFTLHATKCCVPVGTALSRKSRL